MKSNLQPEDTMTEVETPTETTTKEAPKKKASPQAKIEISKKELAAELRLAMEATERRSITIPILGTMLLRAEPGELTLAATDLSIGYRAKIAATVAGSGSICVRAKNLSQIVPALPDAPVTIVITDQGATLTCERSTFKLPGMSPDNFPVLPEGKGGAELTVRASVLREEIRCVVFALSEEESRYTLNGALLKAENDRLMMVATDGHRMALIDCPAPGLGNVQMLIPKDLLSFLQKALASADDDALVSIRKDDQHLYFEMSKRLIISRQLTGTFPAYEAVIPKDLHNSATVDASLFLGALRRVYLLSDERSKAVALTLSTGQLRMECMSGEFGEAVDELMVETKGEQPKTGFNCTYLIDFLSAVSPGRVRLEMKDENSAARLVLCPEPEDKLAFDYQYVVMPMRV
jgi:DNA polymerase-3 subunit beta